MTAYYLEPVEKGSEKIVRRNLNVGFAWLACVTPGKYFYKLISALAKSFDDAWTLFFKTITDELNPYSTTELIDEWEKALSLPDKCLGPATDIDRRRALVIWRLSRKRYTTAQDWKDLAWELFGLRIRVTPGWRHQKPCLYPAQYPVRYDLFPKLGRFRVYIDVLNIDYEGYPYSYPMKYGANNAELSKLKCILDRIRPINSIIIWNEFPEYPGSTDLNVFSSEFSSEFS